MTRRITTAKAALGAIALATVLGLAASDATAYDREERFEKRVPLEGAARIVISNARGDVRVTGERSRSDVRCEYVKMVRGRSADESNALFDQMTIEVKRSGADLVITARYPERGSGSRGLISFLRQQYATMSIDIAAAWEVMEKFDRKEWDITIQSDTEDNGEEWGVSFIRYSNKPIGPIACGGNGDAGLPLAICRAALLATLN